ncbi:hypothetical protein NC652_000681 [Populus alba x Populus x berolinensis]|nr:hypothetical protein NC652_000681 [Populus alba x Populus x berolinensis]
MLLRGGILGRQLLVCKDPSILPVDALELFSHSILIVGLFKEEEGKVLSDDIDDEIYCTLTIAYGEFH